MRKFHLIASGFILICAASPAFAQMAPGGGGLGGMGGMGAPGGAATPQPRAARAGYRAACFARGDASPGGDRPGGA